MLVHPSRIMETGHRAFQCNDRVTGKTTRIQIRRMPDCLTLEAYWILQHTRGEKASESIVRIIPRTALGHAYHTFFFKDVGSHCSICRKCCRPGHLIDWRHYRCPACAHGYTKFPIQLQHHFRRRTMLYQPAAGDPERVAECRRIGRSSQTMANRP